MQICERNIAVIGAGIIGVNVSLCLVREGYNVILVDRDEPGRGCSFGNAGLLARSSIYPLSDIKTLFEVPSMLFDPVGPLSIKLSYLPKFLPWLARYIFLGLTGDAEKTAKAMNLLTDSSVDLYNRLTREAGASELIRNSDYLQIYRSKKSFKRSAPDIDIRRKFNIRIESIESSEILKLEPALSEDYRFAYRIYDHGFTVDPEALVNILFKAFERAGGNFKKENIRNLSISPKGKIALVGDETETKVDQVVIAAGAFSHKLLDQIGIRVPLDTERGYHITVPNPNVTLSRPVAEGDKKFFATPMNMGLRFAGTVEFAGIDSPPNSRRIDVLIANAKKMIPSLDLGKVSTWMGCRPSLPDSLPVIGASKRNPNVFCAFGHQHVGLTSAPMTGKLIADLISGRIPNEDVRSFGVDRFI